MPDQKRRNEPEETPDLPPDVLAMLRLQTDARPAIWEAAGDNARYSIWSADLFIMPDGDEPAFQVRMVPKAFAEEIRDVAPERMHVIRGVRRLEVVR